MEHQPASSAPLVHPVLAGLGRPLVLASGSPRRRELLGLLGAPVEVIVADVDETPFPDEAPAALVDRLARAKALAVSVQRRDAVVLGGDTVVDLDGMILGKPADADDAIRMLRALSGRGHLVHTGVAVATDGVVPAVETVTTAVEMAELTDAVIEWYVGTGEPLDKAGAYGLQGVGGVLVDTLHGSASSVAGLPVAMVVRLLATV